LYIRSTVALQRESAFNSSECSCRLWRIEGPFSPLYMAASMFCGGI
jgi:hypothetical protein